MKELRIVLEDEEHKKLEKRKGKQTWHDFILNIKKK